MDFPHLSDTTFPDLDTVDVYKFQNNFDYTRWSEDTRVKLCNVRWSSDYADIVQFESDAARDTWFDSLNARVINLTSAARIVPEGKIKLPVPYDVAARYNYLFVDIPIATDSEHMIGYENTNGFRRWYFFVNDVQYLSPNATEFRLIIDVWTNFQKHVHIKYMMLERGHAPVANSDTDTYLADPIHNNRYLLAPDVTFDNVGVTKKNTYVPFGNGTKYVCIASTCAIGQLDQLGEVVASSDYQDSDSIVISNENVRWGWQLHVDGYKMGNGYDYSDICTPAATGYTDGRIANNLTVYAIEAKHCYGSGSGNTFFSDISKKCPQFLNTVKACFVVDESCIVKGQSETLLGYTLYRVTGAGDTTVLSMPLQKADFGYPQYLQRFAKLYTAPYAMLEVTDNDGTTFEIRIEETTTLSVHTVVSVAFPYINMRAYIDGVAASGRTSYTWRSLKDNAQNVNISNSDWFKFCFDWNIPTFALYMSAENEFMLNSFNRTIKQGITQGIVDYQTTMRSANTACENAKDSADTAYTNTEAAALTACNNAHDSAYVAKVNAENNAGMALVASKNNALLDNTTFKRAIYTQESNLDIANYTSEANGYNALENNAHIARQSIELQDHINAISNAMMTINMGVDVQKTESLSMTGQIGAVASAMYQGAQAMGMMGAGAGGAAGAAAGAGAGLVTGAVGGIIQAATMDMQYNTLINAEQQTVSVAIYQNDSKLEYGAANTSNTQSYENYIQEYNFEHSITSAADQMFHSRNTTVQNLNDAYNVAVDTAIDVEDTATQNAANTYNTIVHTSNETYEVTEANADRTCDTVKANAGYTQVVAQLNAEQILRNGKRLNMAAYNDAINGKPTQVCEYTGNPAPDYMRTRGLQIKVKTQGLSAIWQAGDIFVRYGYALNQIWNVANHDLQLMNYFTYWKASDIWVTNDAEYATGMVNNHVLDFIRAMFMRGVTVWDNPIRIGAVDVYAN